MITIEKEMIVGIEPALRGMRNPKNSWDKSDSNAEGDMFCVGENDWSLASKLSKAGTDHRKFMRMIEVYADVTAPLYWWKEFDTYKVGTVRNSCSTMHKIADRKFSPADFSCEHLDEENMFLLEDVIIMLNKARDKYMDPINSANYKYHKHLWWQMIQMLPSSYNQKSTVMLNYEVLANIYKSRKNHKLDEWQSFCRWIETLPYSSWITEGAR